MTRSLIAVLWLGMLWLGMLAFTFNDVSAEAAATFERGRQAEKELRIDEARDLFRQALLETPDAPGVA